MTVCAGVLAGPNRSNLTGHEAGPTLTRFWPARAGDLIPMNTREQTISEGIIIIIKNLCGELVGLGDCCV